MSIELKTPSEIIDTLVEVIENTRKKKQLRQRDLCKNCCVGLSTYEKFIREKTIRLPELIKIMYSLNMMDNLNCLIKYDEIQTLDDIRDRQNKNKMPKRIRKVDEK